MSFSPLLLLILALQPSLFHIIVAEGHYILCSKEETFLATVMSKATHMLHGVHGVDTTNGYVLLVRFALAYLKIF